ncbi:hypothetical protein L950_0223075 [Sphingobacterium sp. IITKGP-BTPF85]|nr:hypothetical protein L950_0223075 [Sphingobacterium sp. IITKGP-BTPF85]
MAQNDFSRLQCGNAFSVLSSVKIIKEHCGMQNLVLFWLLHDTLSMKKKNIWDDSLFYFYPAISVCFNNDTKE